MLKLTYKDLTDSSTFTYKTMNRHYKKIKALEKELKRMKDFDVAITNYLQNHREMDYKKYHYAIAYLEHTNVKVSEIFQRIHEEEN